MKLAGCILNYANGRSGTVCYAGTTAIAAFQRDGRFSLFIEFDEFIGTAVHAGHAGYVQPCIAFFLV